MIRYILFVLCLFVQVVVPAQLRPGKYVFSGGFVGKTITIKGNRAFNYIDWSCTHQVRGQGRYLINSDTLILVFSNPKERKSHKPLISKQPTGDSTTFYLQFGFNNLKPVSEPDILIHVRKDKNTIAVAYAESKTTKITLANSILPVQLHFSCLGYIGDMELSEPGNYKILFPIADTRSQFKKKGDSILFKLGYVSRNQIRISPITGDHRLIVLQRKPGWLKRMLKSRKAKAK